MRPNRVDADQGHAAIARSANLMAIFYRKYIPGYEDSYLALTAQSGACATAVASVLRTRSPGEDVWQDVTSRTQSAPTAA